MTCSGCEKRRKAIMGVVNRFKRGNMSKGNGLKAGLQGSPPVISIAPAPADVKRQGELYVNDIKTTIVQLNKQIQKAGSVGIKVSLGLSGSVIELVSAERG